MSGYSSYRRLNIFSFTPQAREFRKQVDLNLLNFNQPLPLVGQQMVDLVVQVSDFKFSL